jgi:integrase
VQAFLNERTDSGLSPRTVNHLRAILRAALTDAMKWGSWAETLRALFDPPRVSERDVQVCTIARGRSLLIAVRGDRLEALYITTLALGLPHGEARGLRREDPTTFVTPARPSSWLKGVRPRVVMETLGHSHISITMNLYAYPPPEMQREAAAQMDAVLSRPR